MKKCTARSKHFCNLCSCDKISNEFQYIFMSAKDNDMSVLNREYCFASIDRTTEKNSEIMWKDFCDLKKVDLIWQFLQLATGNVLVKSEPTRPRRNEIYALNKWNWMQKDKLGKYWQTNRQTAWSLRHSGLVLNSLFVFQLS